MRIISGTHRGKKIQAPKNIQVRPTTDFAKEGLFNILYNRYSFSDLKVLDLYSGIGGISFEFASRGVAQVHSVELERENFNFIQKTVTELRFDNKIQVYNQDVFQFLAQKNRVNYDLIFADPPFSFQLSHYKDLIEKVIDSDCLKAEGIFVLEHSQNFDFNETKLFMERRKYGNVHFSFFS